MNLVGVAISVVRDTREPVAFQLDRPLASPPIVEDPLPGGSVNHMPRCHNQRMTTHSLHQYRGADGLQSLSAAKRA